MGLVSCWGGGEGEGGPCDCAQGSWTTSAGGDSIQLVPDAHEVGRCRDTAALTVPSGPGR